MACRRPGHAPAACGTSLFNCTGFEFEGNTFTTSGTTEARVGAVFQTCGPESNIFYNNKFDGFQGGSAAGYSAGTIIMGGNDGPNFDDGLHIKCNDYSNDAENNYDVAFTGSNVTVGDQQGSDINDMAPAGNTFSGTCDNPETHLYVESGTINSFMYFHHDQSQSTAIVEPTCRTDPPIVSAWLNNTIFPFVKEDACPPQFSSNMQPGGLKEQVVAAETELGTLAEVYDNWRDGGDTEGLIEFIGDPDNDSYAVRNQLMLVAPSVSQQAWEAAFGKQPAMNPWHLAQALIANSPLEDGTLYMMETYELDGFYQDLVYGEQNGGISMHAIHQSEMAHYHGLKAAALHGLTAMALLDTLPELTDTAFAWNEGHGTATSPQALLALALDQGDLEEARRVVDAAGQAGSEEDYWVVQDLLLELLEDSLEAGDLNPQYMGRLLDIATGDGFGAGQAQAWLQLLGVDTFPEQIILPREERSAHWPRRRGAKQPNLLTAYPNPSNGPVYLVYEVPVGVERVQLRMMDALGRVVLDRDVSPKSGIIELQPRNLATGMHVAGLYLDGTKAATVKVAVVRQ